MLELEPGGRLVGMRELAGGVSADVFGLDIVTAAGRRRRVVYRRHRASGFKQHAQRVTAKEYGLLAALHGQGFAVPEPYLLDDTDGLAASYMMIEWVDGSTNVGMSDLPGALDQMAQFLVGLHSLEPLSLTLPELEPIEDPRTAIVPYLPPTESGDQVRASLRSGALAHDPNRSVLLHGDYWPGNIMWRDGRLVAVIDWEDACLEPGDEARRRRLTEGFFDRAARELEQR